MKKMKKLVLVLLASLGLLLGSMQPANAALVNWAPYSNTDLLSAMYPGSTVGNWHCGANPYTTTAFGGGWIMNACVYLSSNGHSWQPVTVWTTGSTSCNPGCVAAQTQHASTADPGVWYADNACNGPTSGSAIEWVCFGPTIITRNGTVQARGTGIVMPNSDPGHIVWSPSVGTGP